MPKKTAYPDEPETGLQVISYASAPSKVEEASVVDVTVLLTVVVPKPSYRMGLPPERPCWLEGMRPFRVPKSAAASPLAAL